MSRWCVCPSPPALVPKVSPHQTNSKQRLTWALVRHCSKEQFRSGKTVGSRLCYISTRQHSRIQAGMGYCAAGWLYKVIALSQSMQHASRCSCPLREVYMHHHLQSHGGSQDMAESLLEYQTGFMRIWRILRLLRFTGYFFLWREPIIWVDEIHGLMAWFGDASPEGLCCALARDMWSMKLSDPPPPPHPPPPPPPHHHHHHHHHHCHLNL